jgi:ABC-type sugar transport system ATPase subunit
VAGPSARPPLLLLREVTKAFPGQVAVDKVSLEVRRGEVHGLVGENGAGKTTLIKVLAGVYQPDSGSMFLDGAELEVGDPSEALSRGLGFIHQEPALVASMSIAENVTLGLPFQRNRAGLISWRRQRRVAAEALRRVGLEVDVEMPLERLGVAERQLVSVARVLLLSCRCVVFDEVTAPLTQTEVERLFAIIRTLRDEQVSVVYITHRLEEIFAITDRVTVLRNGRWIATEDTAELDRPGLVRLIIGHEPSERAAKLEPPSETDVLLRVRGISDGRLRDVSFDVRRGEVLGIAGLGGSGRTEILETLFGARTPLEGSLELDGKELRFRHPADAVARGFALVTEDRKRNGYVPSFPVWQNITLPWVSRYRTRAGALGLGRERSSALQAAQRLDVRARSIDSPIRELSGGNQQKSILARWLSQKIRLLLLDEPTHGVDVGAKDEIYEIIRNVAAEGLSVVVVSSELEELEVVCDRVLLLVEGRITGELSGDEIDRTTMLEALYRDPATEAA